MELSFLRYFLSQYSELSKNKRLTNQSVKATKIPNLYTTGIVRLG